MTPPERNALLFLSVLLLLGVSVRLVRSRATEVHATRAERNALAGQREAVDSVRSAARSSRSRGRGASTTGGRTSTRTSSSQNGSKGSGATGSRASTQSRGNTGSGTDSRFPIPDSRPIDLDLATRDEIEALPWIGPVLADRIVTNRDSLGPFGSMEQLQRVYGVGPGMARRLEGRVTFSQTPRHFRVEDRGKRTSSGARARPSARPRAP